jgi:hypothetical protein
MRLTVDIPDINERVVLDLNHSASMDDINDVVCHISSHFKNLTVNYGVSGKNWNATMLTASAFEVNGLKNFKCIEKIWGDHS